MNLVYRSFKVDIRFWGQKKNKQTNKQQQQQKNKNKKKNVKTHFFFFFFCFLFLFFFCLPNFQQVHRVHVDIFEETDFLRFSRKIAIFEN